MKKLIIGGLIALVLSAVTYNSVSRAAPNEQIIYVINKSTNITNDQVKNAIPAFQGAVDGDFYPEWHQAATLVQTSTPPPNSWTITISDTIDDPLAAGYHDVTTGHVPFAVVATTVGINWQIILTHELFEMLADPYVDRVGVVPNALNNQTPSVFYMLETADPVERQSYFRAGADGTPVAISDFITERWFDCQGRGAEDFMHYLTRCHQVAKGGYVIKYNNGAWTNSRRVSFLIHST